MSAEWQEDALDQLADLYVAAVPADRDAITRCVERINRRLSADPTGLGESRGPGRRVWFTPPLVVVFDLPTGGGAVVIHVARSKGDPTDD